MRHTSITSRSVKLRDAVDDEGELLTRQILMHGQRDGRIGMTGRDGEVSPFISKVAQALLAIERNRVMDLALNGARRAVRQQRVAPFNEHLVGHIAVQYATVARRNPDLFDARQRLT